MATMQSNTGTTTAILTAPAAPAVSDTVSPPIASIDVTSPRIDDDGAIFFSDDNGCLDRVTGPAVIFPDGEINYYRHGKLHRNGGPAMIVPNAFVAYYCSGMLHRNGGPAVVHTDGTQEFWLYGEHISTIAADGSIFAGHPCSRTLLAG